MDYIKIIILGTCLVFMLVSCKKDKENDIVTKQTLKGMVFNKCTDSGLANVTVYLKTYKDEKGIASRETVSDAAGNFSFENTEIHSSSKYSYAIHIPSKSGDGATTPEYAGFNGTTMHFTGKEVNMNTFLKPRVTPKALKLCFVVEPTVFINYPDSLYNIQQNMTVYMLNGQVLKLTL